MIAKLIPTDGGAPIVVKNDLTLVGRSRDECDLWIDHGSISKLHCLIVRTDGLLFVRDLGSTNGTRVNGQRIVRGALLPGDQLSFARIRYRVHLGPDESPSDRTEAIQIAGHYSPQDVMTLDSDEDSDADIELVDEE